MKHSGRAFKAAFKLIGLAAIAAVVLLVVFKLLVHSPAALSAFATTIAVIWMAFTIFTLYFFRDPDARVPAGSGFVLAPGHGKVDAIEQHTEAEFMGGACQRISIFLSVIDIHVQNAPLTGKLTFYKYTKGQFLSALKAESAVHNENAYMGFEAADAKKTKIGIRLLAGLIARRIVPFAKVGDEVAAGERISLIQFGSRADVYLPLSAQIKTKLGDHVVGGETILATLE